MEQPGRRLAGHEIAAIWHVAGEVGWPFGAYIKLLILTGVTRTEGALTR